MNRELTHRKGTPCAAANPGTPAPARRATVAQLTANRSRRAGTRAIYGAALLVEVAAALQAFRYYHRNPKG